jgi:sn1-specific diacylglycerol lipase
MSLHCNFITHAADTSADPPSLTNAEVKATLRRLSKMVLAGYGGASLLFFGVSPSAFGGNGARSSSPSSPPTSFSAAMAREKTVEEANLTNAVDASEAETDGDGNFTGPGNENSVQEEYSWWDVLLGKHDQEIFERSTADVDDSLKDRASSKERNKSVMKATAVSLMFYANNDTVLMPFFSKVVGKEHLMPRFWVLTDHSRAQIVLVLRGQFIYHFRLASSQHTPQIGTMSLNEIAVDLTCDAETFQPASTPPSTEQDGHPLPGQFGFPSISEEGVTREETAGEPEYHVHGGMLKMAKLMGDVGKPVQLAVSDALHNNPDYGKFVI